MVKCYLIWEQCETGAEKVNVIVLEYVRRQAFPLLKHVKDSEPQINIDMQVFELHEMTEVT